MNKQQLIKNLGYVRYSDTDDERYNYYNKGIDTAISFAKKLAESEKPVVPQFVDTWIQGCKYSGFDLLEAMTLIDVPEETGEWIRDNPETFAKAWLFGYEVENEKLYTARLKGIAKEKESYVYKIIESGEIYLSDLVFIEGESQVYFTQTELEKLKYWNNPAFEIEEVEE